jgi:hypothetical protein
MAGEPFRQGGARRHTLDNIITSSRRRRRRHWIRFDTLRAVELALQRTRICPSRENRRDPLRCIWKPMLSSTESNEPEFGKNAGVG